MDINFQDLEAETIHVCIAWALLNIWVVYFFFFITCTSSGLFFLSYLFYGLFLCTSVRGLVKRDTHYYLATWCVAGWVWCERNHWIVELFLFEIDILGVSRGVRVIDHMLKWLCSLFITLLYLSLSLSFLPFIFLFPSIRFGCFLGAPG
jgi:hypothetical protein